MTTPSDILEFTVHNRVNFFAVQLLDGVWHSVCVAWSTATASTVTGNVNVMVDGEQVSAYKTLAGSPRCFNRAFGNYLHFFGAWAD